MDFDFLKSQYDFELDRKDRLTNALAFPSGVLTALGSLIAVMARSFSYQDQPLTWFFLSFVVAAVAAIGVCLWNLAFAYHGRRYELLPPLGDLQRAEQEWLEWERQLEGASAAKRTFRDELEQSMISAADRNANSNDRRQGYLHRASVALFAVLVLTALAGVPYVVDEATMRQQRPANQQPSSQPESSSAPPRPQTPPPPSFPPNRVIREGEVPPRPSDGH